MKLAKALMLGAVLTAGVAYAEGERTDPNAIARSELMKANGKAIGVLADMAGGKTAFDAAAAEAAKATLIEDFGKIEAVFKEPGADDPASESKPEIWTNWEDFLMKAKAGTDAATALDVASLETLQAGMGALGGTCGGCHEVYRVKK
ncbi:c-type cytochrome [Tabrizicola sp.]|uniref:c-type cytochrome n=1 Tax=Tabrizicola sp. TaxID=2005166 RepID=UPI003F3AB10D